MGKRKTKKPRNVVTFDEEIIRKETASSLLGKMKAANGSSEEVPEKNNDTDLMDNLDGLEVQEVTTEGKKKRKNGVKDASSETVIPKKKKKRTKDVNTQDNSTEDLSGNKTSSEIVSDDDKSSEDNSEETDKEGILPAKAEESKRALKRKKHAKLKEEKKLKAEVKSQAGALNYLSKWKHSRDQWKFEKKKQTWLQQHMFDMNRIPEESWETTIEYFCGSKGAIRKTITDAALKVIEEAEKEDEVIEDDESEERKIKLRRAREIIQRLV